MNLQSQTLENLLSGGKKAIISNATDFRDERTSNLTNDKNNKLEVALILMVRHNIFTHVDQWKCFLDKADPNYYSPKTKKSVLICCETKKSYFCSSAARQNVMEK